MITVTEKKYSVSDDRLEANAMENVDCREGICLSTDAKPTDWENGSTLLEMDTGKVYIYDAQNTMWREI